MKMAKWWKLYIIFITGWIGDYEGEVLKEGESITPKKLQ
jgi:hypothetical protein